MAGIIQKIEEKLGMGGKKEEVKKPEHGYGSGESHQKTEHKEGMVDKIKDKVSGGDHNKQADHGYGGDHNKQADHGYGGDHHKQAEHGYGSGDHEKKHDSEPKEGMMDKIKGKISGGDDSKLHGGEGKKKKKDKKKGEHGHHKDGHSSSSSDSD